MSKLTHDPTGFEADRYRIVRILDLDRLLRVNVEVVILR